MSSKRAGAFRPAARVGVLASSLALLAMLVSPNPALAATAIGAPAGDPITAVCSLSVDAVQASSNGNLYTVPSDGFITSWSSQAAGLTGMVGLEVWRFISAADPVTNTPAVYQLVGATTPVLQDGVTNTLAAPGLAVHAGDLLGMRMEGTVACGNNATGSPLDSWLNAMAPTPLPGVNQAFTIVSAGRLNISATVTPTITPPPPPPPPTCGDASGSSNANDECDQNKNDQTDAEKTDSENDNQTHHDDASSARTNERTDS